MAKDFLSGIEELRKEPVEVRNRYAFAIAFIFTFIILAIWGVSLPSRVSSTLADSQNTEEESNAFDDFAAAFGGYKDKFSTVVTSFMDTYREQQYESASTTQEGPVFDLDLKALISSSTDSVGTTTLPQATSTTLQETATTSTTTVETEAPQIP